MSEWLRLTLERLIAPEPLATDLSGNRSPAYSLSQRESKVLASDIVGGVRLLEGYTLVLRHCAMQEPDRRRAYTRLTQLAEGLHRAATANPDLTKLSVALPMFQEAYDDGMAVWSMTIGIETERK